jgi:uncharacterized membrane protein
MTTGNRIALLKSMSWHLVHTTILVANVYLFTGKIEIVTGIVSVHVISETIVYYIHERVWQKKKNKKK